MDVFFSGNTEMVVRLFEALRTEHVNLRSSVQEALASLAGAYKVRRISLSIKNPLINAHNLKCWRVGVFDLSGQKK